MNDEALPAGYGDMDSIQVGKGRGGGCIGAVILLIVGLGIIAGVYYFYRTAAASQSWPTTSGTVTLSSYYRNDSRDSDGHTSITYGAKIHYKYQVDGTDYHGDRVSSLDYSSSNTKHVHSIMDRYPMGKEVTVHYNPDNPSDALLEPGVHWVFYLLFAVGGFLALMGLIRLPGSLRKS